MKVLKLIIFALIVKHFECSAICSMDSKFVKIRKMMRKDLNLGNSIFVVTDYLIFNQSLVSRKMPSFIRLMYLSTSYDTPIIIVKQKLRNGYMVKINSNMASLTSTVHFNRTQTGDFVRNLEYENCIENLIDTEEWTLKSKVSFFIMMMACHIEPSENPGIYTVSQRLIFVMDENFASTEYDDLENIKGLERKNVRFPEFDKDGLCICEDIINYTNDCPPEEVINDSLNFYIFFSIVFFTMSYFMVEAYQHFAGRSSKIGPHPEQEDEVVQEQHRATSLVKI